MTVIISIHKPTIKMHIEVCDFKGFNDLAHIESYSMIKILRSKIEYRRVVMQKIGFLRSKSKQETVSELYE